MFCTRIFKQSESKELDSLMRSLSLRNIRYEISRPKASHVDLTPQKQQYKAIVSWDE